MKRAEEMAQEQFEEFYKCERTCNLETSPFKGLNSLLMLQF